MNVKDITGQQFGRLTAMMKTDERQRGSIVWLCKCECGNTCLVPSSNLIRGSKQSCGCLRSEVASKTAKTGNNRRTHGMKRTKIYYVWCAMKERCFSESNKGFQNYGGRGITVCDEWKNDFQAFYDYVSKLPHFGEAGYSLDRIDNDGNYEPNNVRWATRIEQNNNRRGVKHGIQNESSAAS